MASLLIEDFLDSSVGEESACNAGDPGLIPGLGRFAVEGVGYPLQYFGLCSPWGRKELDTTERLSLSYGTTKILKHFSLLILR